jgi:hypothetical protein
MMACGSGFRVESEVTKPGCECSDFVILVARRFVQYGVRSALYRVRLQYSHMTHDT